jgi:tetratricopeptide (TPR) repeat protein
MLSKCWPLFLAVTLAGGVTDSAPAAAPQTGKERWRSLAKLPQVNLQWEFDFQSDRGVVLIGDKFAWPDEIASLEREVQRDPADPEKRLRLGRLYGWVDADAKSTQSLARAASLFRTRLAAQPASGLLHTRLGLTLSLSRQDPEAEVELRRGVELAPREWRGWLELGNFLAGRALSALLGSTNGWSSISALHNEFVHAERPGRVPAENLNRARGLMSEAEQCLDKAVALGPQQSEPCFARGCARGPRRLIDFLANPEGDREQAALVLATFAYTPAAVADFQEAARRSPKDYRLVGGVPLFEAWTCAVQAGKRGLDEFTNDGWWRQLPETNRTSILSAVGRIESLCQDPNAKTAAGAGEMLAATKFAIFRDLAGCETAARRAVALDPAREQAWELLVLSLVTKQRWDDLLRAAEDRLKARHSPRNHILVAKAHERLKQWKEAEQQVDAAVAEAPDDIVPHVAKAVLLLKSGAEENIERAAGHLKKAQEVFVTTSDLRSYKDLMLTSALCAALGGYPAEARKLVESVLKTDPDDDHAKEILESLPR